MSTTYDFLLTDWISIGLHKDNLNLVASAIREDKPLDDFAVNNVQNRPYLEKILREEVTKQFSNNAQPLVQVIANSLDARPQEQEGEYTIKVSLKWRKFKLTDKGNGMGLEDILNLLIIPFSSNKNRFEDIGRHGVGFLSMFNYCLSNSNVNIVVETRNGSEGYEVNFYSENGKVEGLRMRLKKLMMNNPKGTKIEIKRKEFDKDAIFIYLVGHFRGIPSYKARIMINRVFVNDDKENKWYSVPVELDMQNKKITQRVGVRFRSLNSKEEGHSLISNISLTSQGVLVKQSAQQFMYAPTISFPPAIQVVEGRDAFKMDENYRKCVEKIFSAIELYIKDDEKRWNNFTSDILLLLPSLMAMFDINDVKSLPNLDNLMNALVPGKKYVMQSGTYNLFSQFFGEEFKKVAFPAHAQACSYWREIFKSPSDLLNDMAKIIDVMPFYELKNKMKADRSFYPNLHPIANAIAQYGANIVLCEVPDAGKICLLRYQDVYNDNLYVNVLHPFVQGSANSVNAYCVLSDFLHHQVTRKDNPSLLEHEQAEQRILDETGKVLPTKYLIEEHKKIRAKKFPV